MKYYETHYEEYIQSLEKYNLHPELSSFVSSLPKQIQEFHNLIVYGPIGSGKYSQVLNIIRKYSPSGLKYDKKMSAQTDKYNKYNYVYRISDIHYEIDMSLLGCNSKTSWHEIFFQIVDIVSIKPNKCGIILCKNFHAIHGELLDVFYSYMQQSRLMEQNIHIKFILLTEQYSFIPNNILNCCGVLSIRRPSNDEYIMLANSHQRTQHHPHHTDNVAEAVQHSDETSPNTHEEFVKKIGNIRGGGGGGDEDGEKTTTLLKNIDTNYLINIKEIRSFSLIPNIHKVPKDIFNIICDNIIQEMLAHKRLQFTTFRDALYDILVYNLDITECIWYILHYFIYNKHLRSSNMSHIMVKIFIFLKHYNNNYRPIYHLESIFFYLLLQIHAYPNIESGVRCAGH